jgi:Putative restriction endonuclease
VAVTVDLCPALELTDEQFEHLPAHPNLKFERTATGALVVVAWTGGETGRRNSMLSAWLKNWNEQANLGVILSWNCDLSLMKLPMIQSDLSTLPIFHYSLSRASTNS